MKPALAQVCSLNSPFAQDIEDYAAGQCPAIELWLTKLEGFVEARGIADARRLFDLHGIVAPVASYQGGLLDSQGQRRHEAWELFARRLELCRELEVGTIVVACDVATLANQQDVERVRTSLVSAAEEGRQRDVRVAVEFQAASALGNNLQTMASLVAEAASPHLGMCLDAFHFYAGPSKVADLELLTAENCFHVQLCDIADVPRELATDSDRILPGEGDIPLEPIVERLREIGYAGHVSIELMNPQIWQVPALQIGEIGMTSLRKVLGQAAMN